MSLINQNFTAPLIGESSDSLPPVIGAFYLNAMGEIWKDIPGYKGRYQVSNWGRVKTLPKTINTTLNIQHRKEAIMKCSVHASGYKYAHLRKNKKGKIFRVHRLVALCFIENEFNKPEVNHIDGNKLNNNVTNLEWVTASENSYHAYRTGLKKQKNKGDHQAAKLSNSDYDFILRNHREYKKRELAEMFGVTTRNIFKIISKYG